MARFNKGIIVSKRKFILEHLEEYGILVAKPRFIPFEVNIKLLHTADNALPDPTVYK